MKPLLIGVPMLAGLLAGGGAPTRATETTGSPSPSRSTAPAEIQFWESRVVRDPADHLSPTRLGVLCLREGRRTGDVEMFTRSERALRVALERNPRHVPALVTLTSARLAQHRFAEALQAARDAYAIDPEDPEACGALGDASLELGDLAEAKAQYERLVRRLPSLFAYGRMANLRRANGDVAGASADLRRALELGREQGGLPEDLAWCHVQLGRLSFERGEWDEARARYDSALQLVPEDRRARDHLAELHAAREDHEAAASAYRRLVEEFDTPELCQALGDVYAAMGQPAESAPWHNKAMAGYLRAADAGHPLYDHHLAGFYADVARDGPEAVRWARKDLARRRTAATLDALAWALYADGKFDEAAKAVDEALALPGGSANAHLLYHASLIHARRGDGDRARECARRAAEVNPKFLAFHVHR